MNKPSCRFCSADPSKQSLKSEIVYGGKPNQKFWQCRDCRIIYLSPPHSEEEEILFYKQEFEKFMAKRGARDKDWSSPEKHFQSNQTEMKRRLQTLKKHISADQKALEIGCSSGFMLSALRQRGLDVYGLDPSEGFIEYVRDKGIAVYKDLPKLRKDQNLKFDLIIHYYVLEHIRNPLDFIHSYMELLKSSGKMIFEVPCATDPLIELYNIPAFDKFYWSAAHHWYFNPDSLNWLLKRAGYSYTLLPEQRYDLSNHLIWMTEGKPGGYGRFADIFGADLDEIYRDRLKSNWLCDTIIAIIEK